MQTQTPKRENSRSYSPAYSRKLKAAILRRMAAKAMKYKLI